jgi:hypothetical protein
MAMQSMCGFADIVMTNNEKGHRSGIRQNALCVDVAVLLLKGSTVTARLPAQLPFVRIGQNQQLFIEIRQSKSCCCRKSFFIMSCFCMRSKRVQF